MTPHNDYFGLVRCGIEHDGEILVFPPDDQPFDCTRHRVTIQPGQLGALMGPAQCKKTGLYQGEEGLHSDFGDKGFLLSIELIGGPHDGEYFETHDAGGWWRRVANINDQPDYR